MIIMDNNNDKLLSILLKLDGYVTIFHDQYQFCLKMVDFSIKVKENEE